MVITKHKNLTKQGLCKIPEKKKKTPSSGGYLIISYSSLSGRGWALIRGWVLIRINTDVDIFFSNYYNLQSVYFEFEYINI